jgi:hypothetical protein
VQIALRESLRLPFFLSCGKILSLFQKRKYPANFLAAPEIGS